MKLFTLTFLLLSKIFTACSLDYLFILYRRKQSCFVMTSKVTFPKKYLGKKIYYKYWVISPNVNPEELLYIHEANADDCSSCYRVRTLPNSKLNNICATNFLYIRRQFVRKFIFYL